MFIVCISWKEPVLQHTAGSDTIFIQIYIDVLPSVSGVSKEPEGHKDQYLDVVLR